MNDGVAVSRQAQIAVHRPSPIRTAEVVLHAVDLEDRAESFPVQIRNPANARRHVQYHVLHEIGDAGSSQKRRGVRFWSRRGAVSDLRQRLPEQCASLSRPGFQLDSKLPDGGPPALHHLRQQAPGIVKTSRRQREVCAGAGRLNMPRAGTVVDPEAAPRLADMDECARPCPIARRNQDQQSRRRPNSRHPCDLQSRRARQRRTVTRELNRGFAPISSREIVPGEERPGQQ